MMETNFDVRQWRNGILDKMERGGITYRALAAKSGVMHMTVWRALNTECDVKASTMARISKAVSLLVPAKRRSAVHKAKNEAEWDNN